MLPVLLAAAVSATTPPSVAAFVRDHGLSRYTLALFDLNGDGNSEALIYAVDRRNCGSGGCDLYVLSENGEAYRLVTTISLTRPPIKVLSAVTHGWHDLAVRVAGGGIIPGYEARLRFDGSSYPLNPTAATRIEGHSGEVVIGTQPAPLAAAVPASNAATCPGQTPWR